MGTATPTRLAYADFMPSELDHAERMVRARSSLLGTAMGDAFGQRFFGEAELANARIAARTLPSLERWTWTDDTAMALSIVEELDAHRGIDRDSLARRFGARYLADWHRGYGPNAHNILRDIGVGVPWQKASVTVFGGEGSKGNGSAMRVTPVGAYFHDDLERCANEAASSAYPTHGHPEARAGASAIAVGAALMSSTKLTGEAFLDAVLDHTPLSSVRQGIEKARSLEHIEDARSASAILGNGIGVICEDTVPFCLWVASRFNQSFEEAMWATVSALGDRDTTCAIVGGMILLRTGEASIPSTWRARLEPCA